MPSHPDGILAVPASGDRPGVLVLHAWWGLNGTIRNVCARLMEAGFTAYAPDLYHGHVAETVLEAEALGAALDADCERARAEIREAARYLAEHSGSGSGGVAVLGFSLGAFYALDLAASAPELVHSVVLYYGTGGGDFRSSRAEFLGHFAESDPYEPAENVDGLEGLLREAGRPATFHRYPDAGHWFAEPDRTEVYSPEAAALAWERTLSFLKRVNRKVA